MKPAPFAYQRPSDLEAALAALAARQDSASLIAGGQSLVPLLNLRMTLCDALIDLGAIAELRATRDMGARIFIGAGVTHAMIEDGLVPDASNGLMRKAAAHIAYRAVRCHGTIGGSVAMADPAADWPCVLLALGATALLRGPAGDRIVDMDALLVGTYETSLQPGEIILGFEIDRLPTSARTAYVKSNRKTGAFATSLAVAVKTDTFARVTLGAASTRARILQATSAALAAGQDLATLEPIIARDVTSIMPQPDAYLQNLHETCVRRAIAEVLA